MDEVKGIRIVSLTGEKEYGIEDSEVREELANVVDGAPEELNSFKEAFEKFKEGGEALAGIADEVAAVGKAVTDEAARAKAAEQVLEKKLDSLSPVGGGGGGVAELMEEVTYSELVALRDNASLVAGMKYRITDYVTTTVQENTKSANHPFDIIVEAVSENELSELAQAIQHEGDTYFDGNDLGSWQLWYSLDNDTDKYAWADNKNGKGVIYRMIDEKRNDCPYDFKNILFYTTNFTYNPTSDNYYYTFSYVVSNVLYDGTVEKRVTRCHDNSIGVYIRMNGNIFNNFSFNNNCHSNTFGSSCFDNIFEGNCHSNTFGNNCYNNIFLNNCESNIFLNNCHHNTFMDDCNFNKFGNNVSDNIFGSSSLYNTFGNDCYHNTFGISCSLNTFGDSCFSNTFENNCHSNTFGNSCTFNKFERECSNNTFGNECGSNTFENNCQFNKLDNNCDYNKLDSACIYNTFLSKCYLNSLRIACSYNILGSNCSQTELRSYTSNRKLDNDYTSITLNEDYYDDGTNALVPIKHPNLSTQPSILPYKFMGQYVYEQLLVTNNGGYYYHFDIPSILAVYKPLIISIDVIGTVFTNALKWSIKDNSLFVDIGGSDMVETTRFFKIVYTSMPEEDSGYYGYNNY